MKLDWILLAEGFGTASNGAVTAIGINQNIILATKVPVSNKRGVMAHFIDDTDQSVGQEVEVTITVYDPSGKPILAQSAPARTNASSPWPEQTRGMDVFLEVPLRLPDYGAYEIALSVKKPGSEPVEGRVRLYVKEPPEPVLSSTLSTSALLVLVLSHLPPSRRLDLTSTTSLRWGTQRARWLKLRLAG